MRETRRSVNRRDFVLRGALAAVWVEAGSQKLVAEEHAEGPRFRRDDGGLKTLYESAQATLRGNVLRLPGP